VAGETNAIDARLLVASDRQGAQYLRKLCAVEAIPDFELSGQTVCIRLCERVGDDDES
jgi:hypothetical protein